MMDRAEWLAQRRQAVVEWYDADAPRYDTHDYPVEQQRRWVSRLVGLVPPGGLVLDVPCGTGKYFEIVVGAGRQVVGIDQSAGMLAEAARRGLALRLEQSTLTDLAVRHAFDAVMTVDAMENVPPEDGRSFSRTSPVPSGRAARCTSRSRMQPTPTWMRRSRR